VVTDELTPTRLLSLLEYPAIASEASSECPDARSYFFIANKGNRAQLHFDGDNRNVLLTQGAECLHRAAELAAEDAAQLLGLLA
jgi:hypothetical protein